MIVFVFYYKDYGETDVILVFFIVEVLPFLVNARKEYLELSVVKEKRLSVEMVDAHL